LIAPESMIQGPETNRWATSACHQTSVTSGLACHTPFDNVFICCRR